MLYRLRAHIRFKSSGDAVWSRDQMALRLTQAVSVNAEAANAEQKINEIVSDGTHTIFRCDLPLLNESHANDAYATIGADSWFHPARIDGFPGHDDGPSWIERHNCVHGDTDHSGCVLVARKEIPA